MYVGFGMGFGMFDILFTVIFICVIVIFIVTAVKGLATWNRNNHAPRLSVSAVVVTKRTDMTYDQHANAGDATGAHGFHTTTTTRYYATFQVESGDRMEFHVNRSEYGMLAEGDRGTLTFQGTRYLGFERSI
ncbi:MAG: DUF2500 domain-containing protein [Lachnospiraceae bacterium]|nr:DUF2500 domain-containing protein [Lachnospiraceae bacterium]